MTLRLVYLLFYQLSARIGLLARSEASRGALKATEKLFSAAAFGSAQVPPAGTTAASRQINGQTTNPRGAQVTVLHRVFRAQQDGLFGGKFDASLVLPTTRGRGRCSWLRECTASVDG